MRIFLDTNVFLRWTFDERLPKKVQRLIASATSDLQVSIMTPWEIAIKVGRSRNKNLTNLEVRQGLLRLGAKICPISMEHVDVFSSLPRYHRDPFDRMIIAQAISEDALLLSSDQRFPLYKSAGLKLEWD